MCTYRKLECKSPSPDFRSQPIIKSTTELTLLTLDRFGITAMLRWLGITATHVEAFVLACSYPSLALFPRWPQYTIHIKWCVLCRCRLDVWWGSKEELLPNTFTQGGSRTMCLACFHDHNHCNIRFENTSKYVDTLTLFSKNLKQRSLTPRWPLTPCLLRSHMWLYPRIIVSKSHDINVCGYSDQFCKIPHTYTYILRTEWVITQSLTELSSGEIKS